MRMVKGKPISAIKGKIGTMVKPVGRRKWHNVKTGRAEYRFDRGMVNPISAENGKMG